MAEKKQVVVRTYPRWYDTGTIKLASWLSSGYRVVMCQPFACDYYSNTGKVVCGNEYILEKECDQMLQFVCNRCKKPIEGATYYTVDIYGHDINPTNDGRDSATTYAQNAGTNMSKMFCGENHYCESCKSKIEDFLKIDDSKTLHFEQTTEQSGEINQVKDYPSYLDRPKKKWGGFIHL